MILPAITIRQPWASLIAIGTKRFETRAHPPPTKYIGQRIAIHAAARKERADDIDTSTAVAVVSAFGAAMDGAVPQRPLGAVVCTAVLAGAGEIQACDWPGLDGRQAKMPKRMGTIPGAITIDLFGDYSPNRWAWLLTDVEPIDPPAPAKGKQGWWMWDDGRVA